MKTSITYDATVGQLTFGELAAAVDECRNRGVPDDAAILARVSISGRLRQLTVVQETVAPARPGARATAADVR